MFFKMKKNGLVIYMIVCLIELVISDLKYSNSGFYMFFPPKMKNINEPKRAFIAAVLVYLRMHAAEI
jgi:hypothetical protein